MSMRKVSIEQTATITWAADTVIPVDVERVGLLTQIDITAEITPSATMRAAVQPNGIWRILRNLEIKGGAHTYFSLPNDDGCLEGSLLHYMNMVDGYGVGHGDAAITAPRRTFTPVSWVYHCGSRPQGPDAQFDLTAFIPAGDESQLRAELSTSGNDVMDDSVTISSATIVLTLHRVMGTQYELQQEMRRQQVNLPHNVPGITGMVPAWVPIIDSPAATAANFSRSIDPTLGGFTKRFGFLTQDATATRTLVANDELTDIRLRLVERSESVFEFGVEHLLNYLPYGSNLTADAGHLSLTTTVADPDFNAHAPVGVYFIDLRPYTHDWPGKDYGLDMRAFSRSNIVLGATITTNAAGDDTLILQERYIPYDKPLVIR